MSKLLSFPLTLKVLCVLFICASSLFAYDVSNAVCKRNSLRNGCEQDPDGLIRLLTKSGDTFALMMRCQFATSPFVCNNLSQDTCVWRNSGCHVSSKKLITQINSCFYTSQQYQNQITDCKNQLNQISNSNDWIDPNSVRSTSLCSQTVGYFTFATNTCKLMEYALQCSSGYSYRCECSAKDNNQAHQVVNDLRYIMGVSQISISLELSQLESQLDIKSGNLQQFYRCSQLSYYSCQRLTSLPSTYSSSNNYNVRSTCNSNSNNETKPIKLIIGVGFLAIVIASVCIYVIYRKRQSNQSTQAVPNTSSQDAPEDGQLPATQTMEIINTLPHLHYMVNDSKSSSEQICVICLESLKQGGATTVLPCAHWFHKDCIQEWITNKGRNVSCPLCNQTVHQQTPQNQ